MSSLVGSLEFFNKKNALIKLILMSLLLSAVAVFLISQVGTLYKIIAFLVVIPVVIFSISNKNFVLVILLGGLFYNAYYLNVYVVIFIPFLLLVAILLENGKLNTHILESILFKPLLLYFFAILLSLINGSNILLSAYLTLNFISFAVIIYVFEDIVKKQKQIDLYINAFIGFTIINGIYVIITALLTNYRVFGFTGIVFVDYAALAILILIVKIISNKRTKTFLYFGPMLFIFVALIFTQSRGALATLFGTLVLLYLFVLMKSEYFSFSKKRTLIYGLSSFLIILSVVVIIFLTKPELFSRYSQFSNLDVSTIKHETDFTESSIFSRLLLWSTSLRAFEAHPIIGIGAFSFPFASVHYNFLSPYLYTNFVKGLSPHVTFLAVLVETGIIGFMFFVFLLHRIYKAAKENFYLSKSSLDKEHSLILYFVSIYIVISMFISDAWLWGQCGILWGIVVGLIFAQKKMLKNAETKT